ncbi:Ger(x)C family spore germination protein [Pradoshia sp.]
MKLFKILCLCALLLPTAGCWDQNFLKQQSLAFSIGYDAKGKEIHSLSIVRTLKPTGSGQTEPFNNTYEVTGKTPLHVRATMNEITPGTYSMGKLRVILIGEDLAKKDIYPLFDLYFREARSNVNTKVIITKGKAVDFLKNGYIQGNLITDAINELLVSGEKESLVPKTTVGGLLSTMYNPGQDLILPYLDQVKGGNMKVAGLALFNKRQNTGKTLPGEKGSLLLLMMNKGGRSAQFSINEQKAKNALNKKVTIISNKSKSKIRLKWDSGKPIYTIDLKLNVFISEYTNGILNKRDIDKLENYISDQMTKMAEDVTKTLNKSNCDALGLGHMMMVQNPEKFKGYDWDKDFKDITIVPKVKVHIISNGILY